MYSLRLIYKKPFEENYEEFVVATHIRIKDDVISFYIPQELSKEPVDFNINDFQYVFINHYMIYTIEEIVECYNQEVSVSDDYDNIMSIFKLVDLVFSKKEIEIFKRLADMSFEEKKIKEHNRNKDSTQKNNDGTAAKSNEVDVSENDSIKATREQEYLNKYKDDEKKGNSKNE